MKKRWGIWCCVALMVLASGSAGAQAALVTAGDLLVNLDAQSLPAGAVAAWTNGGTLGGQFDAFGQPAVGTVGDVHAVILDGNASYLVGPVSVPGIEGAGDVSIEAWVYNPAIADEETILSWSHRGGPEGSNMSFNYGTNTAYGAVGHWGGPDLGWNGTPEAGKWHHLVYTYDGGTQRVYADGVEKNSEAVALNLHAGDPIRLGAQIEGNLTTNVLFGSLSLAQVRIHDGVLSAADVANNYVEGVYTVVYDGKLTSQASGGWNAPATWTGTVPGGVPTERSEVNIAGHAVQTLVPTNRAKALFLTNNGSVTINDSQSLLVAQELTANAGSSITLGNNATLGAGFGSIPTVSTGADPVFDIAGPGSLAVSNLSVTGKAVTKQGAGTMALSTAPGSSVGIGAATAVKIVGGTLRSNGANPLGDSTSLVLSGGTLGVDDLVTAGAGPAGAVATWSFDTDARDSTDNGHDGTLVGGAAIVPGGPVGNAISFDGAGGFVQLPPGFADDFSSGFSFAGWVRPASLNVWGRLMDFGNGAALDNIVFANINNTADARFEIWNGAASTFDVANVWSVGEWQHLAGTIDAAGNAVLYKNGQPIATRTGMALPASGVTRNNNYLARSNWGGDAYYNGLMDEVYIYNNALSPAAIQQMVGTRTAPDMSGTSVLVTADSGLDVNSQSAVTFGPLTMQSGILRTTGITPQVSFQGTTIVPDATAVGFDVQVPTDLGVIDGNLAPVTIAKAGPGTLILNKPNVELNNATFETRAGKLTILGSSPWGGVESLRLAGGTFEAIGQASDPSQANLVDAGDVLVSVKAFGLPTGSVSTWANSGTIAGDFVANGQPEVADVDGVRAVRLNGNSSFFVGPNSVPGIEGASDVSIEAWLYNPSIAGEETIVSWSHRGGPEGSNMSFNYGTNESFGAVGHWGAPDLGWNADGSAGAPAANKWHHLVYTYDGAVQRVYADGVQMNSEAVALNLYAGDPIRIGAQIEGDLTTNVLFASMSYAQLRIHDGLLSGADIQHNYQEGLAALFGAVNMSNVDVTVAADSVFSPVSGQSVPVRSLTLQNGVVTISGTPAGIHFGKTIIDTAANAVVGVNLAVPAQLGPITVVNDAAEPVTIAKSGAADLVLTKQNLSPSGIGSQVTLEARGGRLIGLHESNPFDKATLGLRGGELVLSATAAAADPAVFNNALIVQADGTLTAGKGGLATAAASRNVVLGSATNGVTLQNGTMTARTTDGYSLNLAGPLSGPGAIRATEGTMTLSGGGTGGGLQVFGATVNTSALLNLGQIKVASGTLSAGADINVGAMEVTGGTVNTGTSQVVVSQSLKLDGVTFAIAQGNTFTAHGANLLSGGTLTLQGGNVSVDAGKSLAIAENLLISTSARDLPDGPVTTWTNTGLIAGDFTATGNPTVSTITDSQGVVAKAITFNGSASFRGPNSVTGIEGNETVSVEVWARNPAIAGEETLVAWSHRGGPEGSNMSFNYGNDGSFGAVGHWGGDGDMPWTRNYTVGAPTAGDWHHLVYTYDGSVQRVYADGVESMSEDISQLGIRTLNVHPGDPIRIAAQNDAAGGGNPAILATLDVAAVRIHDGALTPEQILNNYQVGAAIDPNVGRINMPNTNIHVKANSGLILTTQQDAVLGDVSMDSNVAFAVDGPVLNVNSIAGGDGASIQAELLVRGGISAISSPAHIAIQGSMEIAPDATYRAGVSYSSNGGPDSDRVTLAGEAFLDGNLEVRAASRVKSAANPAESFGMETRTVMDVTGGIGTGITGQFARINGVDVPAGDALPEPHAYLGHGVTLEGLQYVVIPNSTPIAYSAVKVDLFQAGPGDTWNDTTKVPGVDRMVDVPDIQQILREAKFNSGKPAVWTDGDFNDDNLVTATDIQMVLSANLFKKGPYASAEAAAAAATPNVALKLTSDGLLIDTQGATINGYILSSAEGLLTGESAQNLGVFQVDSDTEISGQMFFALSGEHLLGQVTGAGLSAEQLAGDLKLSYTVAGQAGTYEATLVVPEPGTIIMLLIAVLAGLWVWRRRRAG